MRHTEVLIVGQGICGILLAFELLQAGKKVIAIDERRETTASRCAGAVVNPKNLQTGKTVLDENRLSGIIAYYRSLEKVLQAKFLHTGSLWHFSDPDTEVLNCTEEDGDVMSGRYSLLRKGDVAEQPVHPFLQRAIVPQVAWIDFRMLENAWMKYMVANGQLRHHRFDYALLQTAPGQVAHYEDIIADKVVFCEGVGAKNNPFFTGVQFTKNKGDFLILSIPDLPQTAVYQVLRYRLVPIGGDRFWVGSNYQWSYHELLPDPSWKTSCLLALNHWLQTPFRLLADGTAERPTTAGQQRCFQQHLQYPNLFTMNGLGTRGFTLGPEFAQQCAAKLIGP